MTKTKTTNDAVPKAPRPGCHITPAHAKAMKRHIRTTRNRTTIAAVARAANISWAAANRFIANNKIDLEAPRNREMEKRNATIFKLCKKQPRAEVAATYGITEARVGMIVRSMSS